MITAAELQQKIPNLGMSAVAEQEGDRLVVRIRPFAGAPNEIILIEALMVRGLSEAEERLAIYTSTTRITSMSPEALQRLALAVALAAQIVTIIKVAK